MAWTVEEKVDGRVRNDADIQREYFIFHDGVGASDETSATQALYDYLQLPQNIPPGADIIDFPQRDIGASEVFGLDPITFEGRGSWSARIQTPIGTVRNPTPVDLNKITFSFNGQAEGGHIQSSVITQDSKYVLAGLGYPQADQSTPDEFNGLINVEGEGSDLKIKGLDLNPPPTTFEINWVIAKGVLTASFIEDLLKWLGTVNQFSFTLFGHPFLPGELFYSSIQGTRRTDEDWEVSVGFSFSRDRSTDEVVVMQRSGTELKMARQGHEYIWIYNLPAWDDTTKAFTKPGKRSAVYVEQVWESKDWSTTSLDGLQALTLS